MSVYFRGAFLRVKIIKNGVLRKWWFYFCLRFRRNFFRHTKLRDWWVFKKNNNNNFGLKGVIEKCMGCFLVYVSLKVLLFLKRYYWNVGLNFCVKFICRIAAIHTTRVLFLMVKHLLGLTLKQVFSKDQYSVLNFFLNTSVIYLKF